MRGHGLSRRNADYRKNRVADYARYDLPAIAAFVREQSAQVPHWIGHSLGGTTLAAALGGQYLGDAGVASAAFFGTQISRTYWPLKIPMVEWGGRLVIKRFAQLSGSRLKRGPRTSPSGWLWRACAGMDCLVVSAMPTRIGGRAWRRLRCPHWQSVPQGIIRIRPGPVASCSSNWVASRNNLSAWGASRDSAVISVTSRCW
ncbi:hypothetical protein PBOI14_23370 [Pseudomonas sp. Boi14]|nr:hypothetical protein PBOI14_23370 [Pseudomonas sp. Boi14]